jgi:hypothetical protein
MKWVPIKILFSAIKLANFWCVVCFVDAGAQSKGRGLQGSHKPSGMDDASFLPSSLAVC